MATPLLDRFELSSLSELPDRAASTLSQQREVFVDRAAETRSQLERQLERQQARALGKLKDSSQMLAFKLASSTLQTAGEILDRSPLKPVPVKRSVSRLHSCARHWGARHTAVLAPDVKDYDSLNVSQVRDALDGLDIHQLEKARAYEVANKNRVTVLRDIDRRLQA